MKTIKLGKLELREYAAQKPIGIKSDGKFIYPEEIVSKKVTPPYGLTLAPIDEKIKLAIERIKLEPEFKLGIIDIGSFTKKEIISQIEKQSELGIAIMDMEIKYTEYLTTQLLGRNLPEPNIKFPIELKYEEKIPQIPGDWKWVPEKHYSLFKARVIFLENTIDPVCSLAAKYRKTHVHPVFASKGYEIICLEGQQNIKSEFELKAKDRRVVYISGVGYGNYDAFMGYNHIANPQQGIILKAGRYDYNLVKGKAIHLLSCKTARLLGPDMIQKGAKSYSGYTENFAIIYDIDAKLDIHEPDLFWACDSQIDISMAYGRSIQQSIADTYLQYDAAIAQSAGTIIASMLFHDKAILRSPVSGSVYGNKSDKIYPSVFNLIPLEEFIAVNL